MGLGSLLSIIVWVVWVVFLGMLVVQMVRARRIMRAVPTSVLLLYWIVWFGWKLDFGAVSFSAARVARLGGLGLVRDGDVGNTLVDVRELDAESATRFGKRRKSLIVAGVGERLVRCV
jgi:hypothetical protein